MVGTALACRVCPADGGDGGGGGVDVCTERLYHQFTHVCTSRPPDLVPSYRACCCRLPADTDTLLCCRHLYDPLTYLCVDSVDVVSHR